MRRAFSILTVALLGIASAFAGPVRITTWNLRPNISGGTNEWSPKVRAGQIAEAADALKKLKPDVIVLQQMADWKACDELAQALLPEKYQVVICSAFRDPRTKAPRKQVAILSHAKAYISWTEPWQTNGAPGGYAFAAIRIGGKNTGIFSIQLSGDNDADLRGGAEKSAREESARELIKQIAALQNWTTNRLDALVVAGDFNTAMDDADSSREKTLPMLAGFGFENALAAVPREQRVTLPGMRERVDATVDYLFTRNAGTVSAPLFSQVALSEHAAVTCDLDSGSPAAPIVTQAPVAAPVSNVVPTASSFTTNSSAIVKPASTPVVMATIPANRPQWLWPTVAFIAGGGLLFLLMRWRGRRSRRLLAAPQQPPFVHIAIDGGTQTQLQISPPASRGVALPEDVRVGVAAQFAHWLKQKFVQRLVSDRAQLLETQQAAALKVLAVDERLAKIERQIAERNREYEERIDDLLKELTNAREENRELIRAKIALIKTEMEKERAKAERFAREHSERDANF
jgi:exonuclease III